VEGFPKSLLGKKKLWQKKKNSIEGTPRPQQAMASFRSLRQAARLAQPLANGHVTSTPAASSGPLALLRRHTGATRAATLSTQAGGGGQLPFYVTWIGSYLGSSLNRAQLDAFAAQYLPAAADAVAVTAASPTAVDSSAASVRLYIQCVCSVLLQKISANRCQLTHSLRAPGPNPCKPIT
jgi:hypothetical protein